MDKFKAHGEHAAKARREKGLSRGDLARLMGYKNISKGSGRIADIEAGSFNKIQIVIKLFRALDLDLSIVHQAFADDFIEFRKNEFESWLASRFGVKRIFETRMCHACPFCTESDCHHPLNQGGPRKLRIARWIGIVRPQWCPLGFPQGYDEHMVEMEIDGISVAGRVSNISPKCFTVTIDRPFSGIADYPPNIPNVAMGRSEHYSTGPKLTVKGERTARELLSGIYHACKKVEENIDKLSTLYQDTLKKEAAFEHDTDLSNTAVQKKLLRKQFKNGEIDKALYDRQLKNLRDEGKLSFRRIADKKEAIRNKFNKAAAEITGIENCGDLLWSIIVKLNK